MEKLGGMDMFDFKWPDGMFSNNGDNGSPKKYSTEDMVLAVVVTAVLGLFFGAALTYSYLVGL